MKKTILVLITILFTNLIIGQSIINDSNRNDTFKYPGLTTMDQNPLVLIVVDSKSIKLEKISNYDIKPKWIESIDVLKDDISKQIYGNKNGVIIIYTKKKYRKRVLKEIENKNGT